MRNGMGIMHRVYLVENYLENIYILSLEKDKIRHKDVTELMGRAKSVVTKAIRILEKRGYITYEKDKIIRLTKEGSAIAEQIYEKHLYIKKILLEAGVDEEIAEKESCSIEHVLSYESFKQLKKYIEK
ncbi:MULTISPECIES: metal-dependent transcriptional regulator [Streptococcus anginosus group]|mgnify:CR=1 FL=1|jgi:iron-dependent repressor protein|nr:MULTISPECIES: metal-dependent transcriptional regulator [Streptococcus anginosus group]AGU83738.1 transcriptional regulator [Streptococcus anginosus C238]MDP1384306.1 metal-dependent transcriptional regulator [Streptococcus anginosus]